jgi:hypothetical protein
MVHIIESQLSYIISYVRELRTLEERGRPPVLDTLPEAQRRWTGAVENRMRRTVWATGGCVSWYQNAAGRNPTLWPGSTISFRRATRRIDTAEFEVAEPGIAEPEIAKSGITEPEVAGPGITEPEITEPGITGRPAAMNPVTATATPPDPIPAHQEAAG